jgi:hypothetical protein
VKIWKWCDSKLLVIKDLKKHGLTGLDWMTGTCRTRLLKMVSDWKSTSNVEHRTSNADLKSCVPKRDWAGFCIFELSNILILNEIAFTGLTGLDPTLTGFGPGVEGIGALLMRDAGNEWPDVEIFGNRRCCRISGTRGGVPCVCSLAHTWESISRTTGVVQLSMP